MDYRLMGLPAEHFSHLFACSDQELARRHVIRRVADGSARFPCRVSLTDAPLGHEVLLLNYEYHPVASPYRGCFAIYVRAGEQTYEARNQVPAPLRKRQLAVRAYDDAGMLVACELTHGTALEQCVESLFANASASYLHAHYAEPGCYAARIERA